MVNTTTESGAASERSIYELGYHIVGNIPEDKVPGEVGAIKEGIESLQGVTIMEEYPVHTPLAYPILHVRGGKREKLTSAYFGWVKFELIPSELAALKEMLEGKEHVLRFLLIKTVREDTRIPKRVLQKQEATTSKPERVSRKEVKEKAVPVSEEELDRSIAGLVVE